jgi:hypothetical protein
VFHPRVLSWTDTPGPVRWAGATPPPLPEIPLNAPLAETLSVVVANLTNNLPAVLVPLGAPAGTGAVLSALLGVSVGPNRRTPDRPATLLWRRVTQDGRSTSAPAFTHAHGAEAMPVPAVVALWASLKVAGVRPLGSAAAAEARTRAVAPVSAAVPGPAVAVSVSVASG